MRLWEQLGGARPGRPSYDEWLSQYAETTSWWQRHRRGRARSPNHATPYLDVILPPCAAICLFISMWAVIGIGMDWHSGTWRGDLLILLLAVGLPLVLAALRHWLRRRA